MDVTLFAVEHPEQYPIVAATERDAPSQLVVTGAVVPDIARTVPVVTLASGRVVDIRARLGDTVQKDQVLLRMRSDDVTGGFDAYRKAVADELLARKQLDRTKDLYEHGAMAVQDVEVAQDNEDDAKTTLDTATEHLRLIGNDPDNPTGIVDIRAPISGVITDQEVTNASTIQSYSANPFTISDLSYVWILCDVYENDIPSLHVGESADVRLNAYPGRVLKGTISNIGALLDQTIRTAKVRIEVRNPGFMFPACLQTPHSTECGGKCMRLFRPRPLCICTTAIGSMRRPRIRSFAACRSWAARCCRISSKSFCPACSRDSVS